MLTTRLCLLVMISGQGFASAKPFLTNLIASASSAASASPGNIADLRFGKLQDDFFKESTEDAPPEEEAMKNDVGSSFIQQKLNKIVQKIRFFSTLGGGMASPSSDDEFKKEQDAFDKEFEEDSKGDLKIEEGSGYFYPRPKSAKQMASASENSNNSFNPSKIGVFFMELIGSLVGLAYGAVAQLNQPGTTTPPIDV